MAKDLQNMALENMSLDELKTLQKDVTKAIETYRERQRLEILAVLEAKAREMGFTLSELTGGPTETGPEARMTPGPGTGGGVRSGSRCLGEAPFFFQVPEPLLERGLL